jgi:uncharacterized protein
MTKRGSNFLATAAGFLRPKPQKPDELMRVVNQTRQTEIGTRIAVADRGPRRRKGLLGRDGLDEGEGLWIVPCESVHTFGMRFAIDLVYLDRAKRVVKVRHSVGPARISASFRAHSILELRPGTVAATKTQPGDQMEFLPAPEPFPNKVAA